jgi:putative phage-type endonuclease
LSAVLLGTFEHDTPEWHAARAGGIGASEIAAVVGLSPYVSAFHLWHMKKGNLPSQAKSDAMDWGHRLEPVVRDWWQERHPELWVGSTGTWAHSERPWQRVNPDGILYPIEAGSVVSGARVALYEGKTSRFGDGFGPSGSDQIPLAYRCQVQHSLDIFDLPRAYVAVLIGGNEPREYVIEADPADQAALREAGAKFWQSLQDNDEPPIDCSDSTYEAVRKMHDDIDPDAQHPLDMDLWQKYLMHKVAANHHEAELQGVKSKILAAMSTARTATFNDEPVLRRQKSSTGTPYLKEIA